MEGNYDEKSGHIYDICKLWPLINGTISDKLVLEVRNDLKENKVCCSVAEGIIVPDVLHEIHKDNVFESDYKKTTSLLLFEELPYEEAIKTIEQIIDANLF